MNKIELTKKVVGFTIQYGSGLIISGIVRSNVAPANVIQKVGITVGVFAISGAVGNAASKYTDILIDEIVDAYNEIKEKKAA